MPPRKRVGVEQRERKKEGKRERQRGSHSSDVRAKMMPWPPNQMWRTCRFGSEGRRAGETRVDFDDAVVLGVLVESVLDVALSDDAEMSDDLRKGRVSLMWQLCR